ncbi:MAG: acetoacetate--CoA ligase [Legionellaceae bacterium]|nr:acetoacetate--CoA ligase [Legionellaceae bacterium]
MRSLIWQPDIQHLQNSRMWHFLQWVNRHYEQSLEDYFQLHRWSVEQPEAFWESLVHFLGIRFHSPWQAVRVPGKHPLDTRWFTGARFNFAEQLLQGEDTHPALVCVNEQQERQILSFQDLRQQVAACAQSLRDCGVSTGDRVAGVLPNNQYPVIAMLAAASLGAVWACCSPDFGTQAIIDRLGQIEPRVLFMADGHWYNGKAHSARAKIQDVSQALPSLQHLVLCPVLAEEQQPSLSLPCSSWAHFLAPEARLVFQAQDFSHPLYILFSSGTTGKPKCMVHGAGGTLLQHMKELALHCDLHATDNMCFYTTTGWMMWNWMLSGLSLGTTLTLYEGSPSYPDPYHLFALIEQEKISHFGTGAKFISALEKAGVSPIQRYTLPSMRMILATGSPLLPQNYDYVQHHIKADIPLCSISGGSDIISCFALGNPLLPVHRGELQCLGLGMDVAVFNAAGEAVVEEKGELVCRQAFPSMPIAFWNDPDKKRYYQSYFARFPHIWAHGDYASISEHGGLIIYGRSDAVLNPGGVRIGTAEIYRQVEKIQDIVEAVAVGQPWEDDERIVLFVKLQEGLSLDETLIDNIRQTIRQHTSPRHVPAKIVQVPDIPRTLSGKIVELAVKQTLCGQPVLNQDSLANPEALRYFREIPG